MLPTAVKTYSNPDQKAMDKWLTNAALPDATVKEAGSTMRDGNLLTAIASLLKLLGL